MEDSIRECFEKFVSGLEAKKEHLKGIQESIAESSKELDLRRQSAEEFLVHVTKKEDELKQMQLAEEKGLRDWEMKNKEMDLMWKKLEGQQKLVVEELGKLENFQKSLNEKWKIKEKILAFRTEALDAKEKDLVARERLLDVINTDEPDNNPNGADSAQQTEYSTRSQSKRRRTMALDSVKDRHNTPSPTQQPPMPLPAPQATTVIPEQGQQDILHHDAATTPSPTPSSSVKDSRIVIESLGDSFSHYIECTRVIEGILQRSFPDHSSKTFFFRVPSGIRDMWFTQFKQFFRWSGEHDTLIRANWNKKCSQLFDTASRRTMWRQIISATLRRTWESCKTLPE